MPNNPKQARLELGLSQSKMARAMGVHRQLWVKWERGEQRITAAPTRLLDIWLKLKSDHPRIFKRLLKTYSSPAIASRQDS